MGNFARRDEETGLIHIIDEDTGKIVAYANKPGEYKMIMGDDYVVGTRDDGTEFLVRRGDTDVVVDRKYYPFSNVLCDIICQRVVEGERITKICGTDGIPPYGIISKWFTKYPDFKEAYVAAKAGRAEVMHDKVLDAADEVFDKDDAPAAKVKSDAYKWSASKSNPDEFGDRTKVVGDKNAPVQIIIDTGIRKVGDPGYNKDESVEVYDVTPEKEKLNGSTSTTVHDISPSTDERIGGDTVKDSGGD
jgi:hypothetical protein